MSDTNFSGILYLSAFRYTCRASAEIAQVVERGPEKPGVPSASLGLGTIFLNPNNAFQYNFRHEYMV